MADALCHVTVCSRVATPEKVCDRSEVSGIFFWGVGGVRFDSPRWVQPTPWASIFLVSNFYPEFIGI